MLNEAVIVLPPSGVPARIAMVRTLTLTLATEMRGTFQEGARTRARALHFGEIEA